MAALGVAVYHVRVNLWIGSREILAHQADHGWLERISAVIVAPSFFFDSGVILFFVISGFCIHWPVALRWQPPADDSAGRGAPSWRRYFIRRLLRIYPPYAAAVLLTIALESAATGLTGATKSSCRLAVNSFFMVQNYLPPQGQMAGNPPLWSVPVEVELYVVYPALLAVAGKWGWRRTVGLVAVVSVAASLFAANGCKMLEGNFLKFWVVWAAGAWLAESLARKQLRPFGGLHSAALFTAGGLAMTSAGTGIARGLSHLLYGCAFVLLLWWLTMREVNAGETRDSWPGRCLRRLGESSYSLYLIHFPVFLVLGAAWVRAFGSKPASPAIPCVGLLVVVLLALAFYRFIESPSHRLARRARQAD